MAKRRGGRKAPRRRRSRDISLLNVAQSLAVGNIAMEGLAGTSIPQFITGSGSMSLKGCLLYTSDAADDP